jgi:AraC-like DNA-binding protein
LNKRDKLFIQIKDYIDQHYTEEFTMEKLSQEVHMSTSNLTHQFKKRTGFSPVQYIIRRRIGRAQSLLISSDMSITDVSAEVGYDNLSYFNNQFKKIVGMSPQVYRKYRVGDNQYKRLNQISELWQKK